MSFPSFATNDLQQLLTSPCLARLSLSSLISFTARQRYIGEAAKTAETSNFKNTIGSLKRLIGRRFDDPGASFPPS